MDDLVSAIKNLRTRLGDSQQVLANRLGVSSRAIANYEAGRRPTMAVLFDLQGVASQAGHDDLANVFSVAYSANLRAVTRPYGDEEKAWVRLILTLLRNKESVPELAKVGISLVSALEGLIALADQNPLKTEKDELKETLAWARHQITPDAEQRLHRMAAERGKTTGEGYHKARTAILLENPELYKEYQEYLATLQPGDTLVAVDLTKPKPTKRKTKPAVSNSSSSTSTGKRLADRMRARIEGKEAKGKK